MKKMFVLAAALVSSFAFSQRIQQGGGQVNAGVGFSSGWGIPVYAGYDYGITNDITVGVQASYTNVNDKVVINGESLNQKSSWFGLGVNGNYHFNRLLKIPNNFDVYAGLTLAYDRFSYRASGIKSTSSGDLGFAGQIGGRYFFNNKFGINLEFGGGNVASGGKIGITYKLY